MTAGTENKTDWTLPGPHEVAPGLHRIPLPLPMTGLTAVNCYVAAGPGGVVLVDPGWATDESERAITRALGELGFRLDDVALCVSTHHHWDHYSQAYSWRLRRGMRLVIGHEERHSILDYAVDAEVRYPVQTAQLREEGAGDLADRLASSDVPMVESSMPYGPPDAWLRDGDRIDLADGAFEVIATPGHTRGHIILRHTCSGAIIAGDHVLPRITPSIGFEWSPEPSPLRSFMASMHETLALPDGALLPAHGPVLTSTHARVREQIAHHEERLAEVGELLRSGHCSSYAVARAMRWTRHRKTLDELPVDHQMIAVGEIRAHLEVLRLRGEAAVTVVDGLRRYGPDQSPQ